MNTDLEKVSLAAIASIESCGFLPVEDMSFMKENEGFSQEVWEKSQIWRTEAEIEASVLNDAKYPTAAAKYWQCSREYKVFFEQINTLSFEYRKNNIEIERIRRKAAGTLDELDQAELAIDLEEKLFAKRNMEIQAKDRVREIRIWRKKMEELDDGSFDTSSVESSSRETMILKDMQHAEAVLQGAKITGSEARNLFGRLGTATRKAEADGTLDDVLKKLPKDAVNEIMPRIGFNKNPEFKELK